MDASRGEYVSGAEVDSAWRATLDGRYEEALKSWDSIVRRDSGGGRHKGRRGITRLLAGELEGALADFLETRDRPGKPKTPVPFVGATLWLMGQQEAACEDWAHEISRKRAGEITHADDAGGVEAPALLWWASTHADLARWRPLAADELRRRGRTRQCQQSRWPGPLVPFLLGKAPQDTLLAAAAYPNLFYTRRLCQAHFYIGAAHLSEGDPAGYREHLELAAAQDGEAIAAPEYHLARSELSAPG